MKLKYFLLIPAICFLSITPIYSQIIKAAVLQDPGSRQIDFFNILSEKSGIQIHQIPLLPGEIERALDEGLVDIAIMPDNRRIEKVALIQTPVFGKEYALISNIDFFINERNMMNLRTIAVFVEDEPLLIREVIDRYAIEPRIQKARHYDSLVKLMTTGRVSAIFIPLDEFERSLRIIHGDPGSFNQPFIIGFKEDFLVLSKRRADKIAPLMDRLIGALEQMKNDGTMEELSRIH